MKNLRKIIPLTLLGISALAATGCSMYSSKADTKENMIGLYELDIYQSKRESADEDPYDRKAEEGIVAYFTLDENGYGYYGYKDNETAPRVDSVFSTFVVDDDEPELFKAIEMKGTNETVYAWEKKVGCLAEPTMGFRRQEVKTGNGIFKKTEMVSTFSYTIPWHEYNWYTPHKIQKYQYVSYKKISNDTGYQKINELLGTSYTPDKPYEMKSMYPGYYPYRANLKESDMSGYVPLYEYCFLDMNSYANGKLDIIYSLKEQSGQTRIKVDVSVNEMGKNVAFTFNDKKFVSSAAAFESGLEDHIDDPYINSESFIRWYSDDATLEEVIAQETNQNL